jgi:hypothetical protein
MSFLLRILSRLQARLSGTTRLPSEQPCARRVRRPQARSSASRSGSSSSTDYGSTFLAASPANCCSPSHLDEILTNAELRLDFEKFCAVEFADENLAFLHACDEFTSSFYDMSKPARTTRFKKLVKTFIAPNGPRAVNLPSQQIEALMTMGEDEICYDAFGDARKEVAQLLEMGQARRFRSNSKT